MPIDNPNVDAVPEPLADAAITTFAALPELQRRVITMAHWEQLDYREIGERLDLPPESVARALRTGLGELFAGIDARASELLDQQETEGET